MCVVFRAFRTRSSALLGSGQRWLCLWIDGSIKLGERRQIFRFLALLILLISKIWSPYSNSISSNYLDLDFRKKLVSIRKALHTVSP